MHSSQMSRLEGDQQLSSNPSSGDLVPDQSLELQAGVSSNAAALQVSTINPSRSVLSCGPHQGIPMTAVLWQLTVSSHSGSPSRLQKC